MVSFTKKVWKLVQSVPPGKVVSYGQVAIALGAPRLARQVGWALYAIDDTANVPWWRVVNSKGYLSIRGNDIATKDLQRELLLKEGIEVDSEYCLDFKKYNFNFK